MSLVTRHEKHAVKLHDLGLKARPILLVEVWSLPKKWSWCIKASNTGCLIFFVCSYY